MEKVYLSRSRFKTAYNNAERTYGEERIEKIFADNGFTIIHPEKLSIPEQISCVKNCRHIAGVAGSALHLSIFAGDNVEVTCIHRSENSFPAQLVVNKMKQIKYNCIEAYFPFFPIITRGCPYMISVNDFLKSYFLNNGFKLGAETKVPIGEFCTYMEEWLFVAGTAGYREFKADKSFTSMEFRNCVLAMLDGGELKRRYDKRNFPKWKKLLVRVLSSFIPIRSVRKRVREKLKSMT